MATNQQPIKGPAIFLAQFMGKEAPFDTLENMAKWAASLGYKGIQVPTDPSLFDLEKQLRAKSIATTSLKFAKTLA